MVFVPLHPRRSWVDFARFGMIRPTVVIITNWSRGCHYLLAGSCHLISQSSMYSPHPPSSLICFISTIRKGIGTEVLVWCLHSISMSEAGGTNWKEVRQIPRFPLGSYTVWMSIDAIRIMGALTSLRFDLTFVVTKRQWMNGSSSDGMNMLRGENHLKRDESAAD